MAHRKNAAPVAEEHNGTRSNRLSAEDDGPGRDGEETASENARAAARGWMDPQTSQRAEEMVDRFAANVGSFVQRLGHQALRLAARAREEAEDILAEANSIRQRRKA